MKTVIEHFYWVAQANGGKPGESAFHVQVIEQAETMEEVAAMGGVASRPRVLDIAQAEAAGFTLETIGKLFSTELAAANEALKNALEQALTDLASAQAELTRLTS